MNPEIYRQFCQLLDLESPLGSDYKTLGSHLNYTKMEMNLMEKGKKPTEVMLDHWGKIDSGNTVLALAKIVQEKVKRSDALEKLAEELKLQRKKCNCGSCPAEIPSS